MRYFIYLAIFWTTQNSCCQDSGSESNAALVESLMNISSSQSSQIFLNSIPIDTLGGHLQGVQLISQQNQNYALLSGSSNSQSYFVVIKMGKSSEVTKIQKILDKPFKHAGGFQFYQDFLAVGIEDNDARNHSFVMIFDVSDVAAIPNKPLIKIERKGTFERATAGCVGLVQLRDRWLMVVGDWNTEHLDYYVTAGEQMDSFSLVQSSTTKELNRTGWIDDEWLPYQNLNFILHQEELYLTGMTSDDKDKNIIDLYTVERSATHSFRLQKIASKTLVSQGGKFIWSAGLQIKDGLIIQIISSDRNLNETSRLYFYK